MPGRIYFWQIENVPGYWCPLTRTEIPHVSLPHVRIPQEQGLPGSHLLTNDPADLPQAHGRIPENLCAYVDLFSGNIDERKRAKVIVVVVAVDDPAVEISRCVGRVVDKQEPDPIAGKIEPRAQYAGAHYRGSRQ